MIIFLKGLHPRLASLLRSEYFFMITGDLAIVRVSSHGIWTVQDSEWWRYYLIHPRFYSQKIILCFPLWKEEIVIGKNLSLRLNCLHRKIPQPYLRFLLASTDVCSLTHGAQNPILASTKKVCSVFHYTFKNYWKPRIQLQIEILPLDSCAISLNNFCVNFSSGQQNYGITRNIILPADHVTTTKG